MRTLKTLSTLLALAGALTFASPAAADTFTGALREVYRDAPTEENPRNKENVHELHTAQGVITLAELEPFAPLASLEDRGQVTLEGTMVDGRLQVERIAAPSVERFSGVLYRTKRGLAGRILVQLEGQEEGVRISGLPWLAFRKMTSDLSRHEIEFDAFPVYERGKLVELVALRVKATAADDLVLTENVLGYRGEVPAGKTVWLTRRSLIGISALVEGPEGQRGFALWDNLQIGQPVPEAEGAADKLKSAR